MKIEKENDFEQVAVLWSNRNTPFLKKLCKQIQLARKGNSGSIAHLKNWTIIGGQKRFERTDFRQFSKIIVLAEMNWNGANPTNLYGVDILQQLRFRHSLITNGILVSFLPLNIIISLRKEKDYEHIEILRSNFIQLPSDKIWSKSFIDLKTLSIQNNSIHLLRYFFGINHDYMECNSNHKFSLIADLTQLVGNSYKYNHQKIEAEYPYILSRIKFMLNCWGQIEAAENLWEKRLINFYQFQNYFIRLREIETTKDFSLLIEILGILESIYLKEINHENFT